MSPLSRNPRDATIQLRDIQRWGRCRGSLRGRSHGRHVHRPSLDRWARSRRDLVREYGLALPSCSGTGRPATWLWSGPESMSRPTFASCPRSRRPRGCGLVRSRCPPDFLRVFPRSRRFHGCGLVRNRRPDQPLASCPGSRRFHGCSLVRVDVPNHFLASCPRSCRAMSLASLLGSVGVDEA